jgi:hypothetical protein
MASTPPFKHLELATREGTADWPNEDYAAAGPDWAIVLDGATHFDGVDTGCIHDVPWLVRRLAAALAGLIREVREAERRSPPPGYVSGKPHDDATRS